MPLTLVTNIPTGPGRFEYLDIIPSNFAQIQAYINALEAKIDATSGEGAELILDVFDRPGIVGTHSYVLDLKAYTGGAEITIGRRPLANIVHGDQDVSYAWGIFGGQRKRVSQQSDVTLDATPFLSGLPKTIYVGIPSGGTAQLYPDNLTANVLYVYSMTWNGFTLSNFRRLGHLLPAYSLIQQMAGRPRVVQIFDPITNWRSDVLSQARLPLHGGPEYNGIEVEAAQDIVGGFIDIPRGGRGRFHCPGGNDRDLVLEVRAAGLKWNLGEIRIDVANTPNRHYFAIDTNVVGDLRYATEPLDFELQRLSIGADVVCAQGFTFGLFVKPIFGMAIPKDPAKVDQV
jgi:hypothetical protein